MRVRRRRRIFSGDFSRITDSASFIYAAYKPEIWYWEILEVYKSLFLVAIFPATLYGNVAQFPVTVLFCLGAVKLCQSNSPYASTSDAVLAEVGQYQMLLVYFVGYVIYFESFDDNAVLYDYLLVIASLLILLLALYFAYDDYIALKTLKPKAARIVKKLVPLLHLNLYGNDVHKKAVNDMLCHQYDAGIERMLRLVFNRLTSIHMENTCFYYYPMTPLTREFHMLNYNTVETYCKRFNVHLHRIDTIDIDRVTFVCHCINNFGKSVRVTIPELAFGRYLYRSDHRRVGGFDLTVLQSPDHFRRLCQALITQNQSSKVRSDKMSASN